MVRTRKQNTRSRIDPAKVALTEDGRMFANAEQFLDDTGALPAAVLKRALEEKGSVFIGIELTTKEAAKIVERIGSVVHEAAAFAVGGRRWRRRNLTSRPHRPTKPA